MDAKGRVTIPTAYRDALGERFTIGLNSDMTTIALYPSACWEKIEADLNKIPPSDIRGMKYVRAVNGNSFTDCQLDAQGRVLLPQTLRSKVGLDKNVRFVGMVGSLEVWDEERYEREETEAVDAREELLNYVNERYYNAYTPLR